MNPKIEHGSVVSKGGGPLMIPNELRDEVLVLELQGARVAKMICRLEYWSWIFWFELE